MKIGDMFAGTWGATMTIPQFFVVVKVTAKRVRMAEYDGRMVRSTDGGYNQQGYEMPNMVKCLGEVIGTPESDGCIRVKNHMGSYMWVKPWDGKPVYADYCD